jgi:hypothetical protein
VARDPKRIEKIVYWDKDKNNGVFGFALNTSGNWKLIPVDDSLPFFKRKMRNEDMVYMVDKTFKQPGQKFRVDFLSLRPKIDSRVVWPLYLEKAYAKVHGGYMNMVRGGDARFALTDLTGAPSEVFEVQDMGSEQEINEFIEDLLKQNFIVCVKTRDNTSVMREHQEEYMRFMTNKVNGSKKTQKFKYLKQDFMREELGLDPSQTYPVHATSTSGRMALILQDPFGKVTKLGPNNSIDRRDYCVGSEARIRSNFQVPMIQFKRLFSQIYCCFYHSNYIHTCIKAKAKPHTFIAISIKAQKQGDYYIRVSQPNHLRFGLQQPITYPKLQLLLLSKDNEDRYQYVTGKQERFRDVWIKAHLTPENQGKSFFLYVFFRLIFFSSNILGRRRSTLG